MKMAAEHTKKIKEIEDKWKHNRYRKAEEIFADYKFLTNILPEDARTYLASKSKAIADILRSVRKYDQYM